MIIINGNYCLFLLRLYICIYLFFFLFQIIPESSKEIDPVEIQNSDIYLLDYSSGSLSLRQWYSPSQSFIWIKPIYKKVKCYESVDAVFYYNVEENQEDFKIFYHVSITLHKV